MGQLVGIDHGERKGDAKNPHRNGCSGTMCPVCGCCMHCQQHLCKCPDNVCTDNLCLCNPSNKRAKEK